MAHNDASSENTRPKSRVNKPVGFSLQMHGKASFFCLCNSPQLYVLKTSSVEKQVCHQYLDIIDDKVGSLALVDAPEEGDLDPELVVAADLVLQLHPRGAGNN